VKNGVHLPEDVSVEVAKARAQQAAGAPACGL